MTLRYFLQNTRGGESDVITVGEKEFEVGNQIYSTNQPFEIAVDPLDPTTAIHLAKNNAGLCCTYLFGVVFVG